MGLIPDDMLLGQIKTLGGEQVVYTPSVGSATAPYAILDQEYIKANDQEALFIVAHIRTVDVTGTPNDGTITFAAGTFNILTPEPDGEGMTILFLGEA